MKAPPGRDTLTGSTGAPIVNDQDSLTAGPRGPVLLQDTQLIEKLAHLNRERIPPRVVHAKGTGAYGTLTVTHDVSEYTFAKVLQQGAVTSLFARFSTFVGEKGAPDSTRDLRGFALKLYTPEGIWDLVASSTPVFAIRDGMKFPDFVHSQKPNPATNRKDPAAMWDFLSLHPESLHMVTMLHTDRGTPASYRHMHAFGGHTFCLVNAQNERVWVKFHLRTWQGIKNNTAAEAQRLAGADPDHATRDLYEAIERQEFPKWDLHIQVMTDAQAARHPENPFDVTKVWPHADYPIIPVGVVELNRNPANHFEEVEQAAFSPGNVVPGIGLSPDKMLQARVFADGDAERHRLGANYQHLPVNRPHNPVVTNQRDGLLRHEGGGAIRHALNGHSLVEPRRILDPPIPTNGHGARYGNPEPDDHRQVGVLYRLLDPAARHRLVENIVAAMEGVPEPIQRRQVLHFTQADREYGAAVAAGLRLGVEGGASTARSPPQETGIAHAGTSA